MGALGISSKTCAESGNERRTATSAPHAETFKAVANSNNSLPSSSRLRTNTGMASGRRGHFRRSVSALRGFKQALSDKIWHISSRTLWANAAGALGLFSSHSDPTAHRSGNLAVRAGFTGTMFALYSPYFRLEEKLLSTFDCKVLPFSDNLVVFSIDRGKTMSYYLPIELAFAGLSFSLPPLSQNHRACSSWLRRRKRRVSLLKLSQG